MGILRRLVPVDALMETVRRFPLSVFCALGLFVLGVLGTHDLLGLDDKLMGRIVAVLGACYFWFGISKIMAESQGGGGPRCALLSVVGGAAIVGLFISAETFIHMAFVLPALLLFLMGAPYVFRGDNISFWFFNRHVWFGVFVSYAALIMFAGGLSVALGAIETLFDIDVDHKIYADIWMFAALVLGPVYALSWVPSIFKFNDDDCRDPPGLGFIVNWISAPMVFVYLLILYAYFIKIIVSGEVPNGHLAYMISGFVGAGIVTYLVAYPLREAGSFQLRLFYRIFFPALLVPVAFHFYAVWERVSAYGFTEQRYMLLLSALWFLMVAVGGLSRRMPLKFIPLSLGMLMALASFGPWGAVSVSERSQFARLEGVLVANGLLEDGRVIEAKGDLSFDDRQSLSSILDYLCRSDREAMIEPWFNFEGKDDWSCSGRELTKILGFDHISRYQAAQKDQDHFYLHANSGYGAVGGAVDVRDYDFIVKNVRIAGHKNEHSASGKDWSKDWDFENGVSLHMSFSDGQLSVRFDGEDALSFDLDAFATEKAALDKNKRLYVIEGQGQDLNYRLYFHSLNGELKEGLAQLGNAHFDFYYRLKK